MLNATGKRDTLRDENAWIGLIGAGALGIAIGRRLLDREGSLIVWNRSPGRLRPLISAGAKVAATVADIVRDANVIVICLSDVDAIRAVLLDGSVNWVCTRDRLVLNTSTIGADASEALEAEFTAVGVDYLEMPVSGGPEGAVDGTLALYLGHARVAHAIVERLTAALASTVIRCSNNRVAQQLKVLNNLCEAINLWGAAEALALGRRLGLSLDDMQAGLTGGRGDSRYLRVLLEHIRTQPVNVAVSLAIRTKDLQLAKNMAGALPPLSTLTKTLFDDTCKTLGMFADQCECLTRLTDMCAQRHHTIAPGNPQISA